MSLRFPSFSRRALLHGAAALGGTIRAGAVPAVETRTEAAGPLRLWAETPPPAAALRAFEAEGGSILAAPGPAEAGALLLAHDRAADPGLPPLAPMPQTAAPAGLARLAEDWRDAEGRACWRPAGVLGLGIGRGRQAAGPALLTQALDGPGPVAGDPLLLLFAAALALEAEGGARPGAAEAARGSGEAAGALAAALEARFAPRPRTDPAQAIAAGGWALLAGTEAAGLHARGLALRFDAPVEGVPARTMGLALAAEASQSDAAAAFARCACAAGVDWGAAAMLMQDHMLAELRPVPPATPEARRILSAAAARLFPGEG